LVDILLSLLNKKEFQPLRKIIVSLSNAIYGECLIEYTSTYNTVEINDLVARFNTKMDQITELLHTEVEYLKKRNSTLKNPAIRKKVNNSVRRVQAQLKGGFKQTRRNRVKKTRRM
jgi:FtsZ-binding cell division protein ZapB